MKFPLTALAVALVFFSSCSKETLTSDNIASPVPAPKEEPVDFIYFISNTGSSSANGHSPESAWDLATANNHHFQPGDVINFVGHLIGSLTLTESGAPGKPITIQGGTLTAKGKNGIFLYNNDHILIRDMQLRGAGVLSQNPSDAGIYLWSDDGKRHGNIRIENVTANGFGFAGIASGLAMSPDITWESEAASIAYQGGFDNILISNCRADSNGFAGINITGSWPGRQNRNITIKNSGTSHNRGIKGMKPHSGHGIVLANTVNGLVDSCTASYNGWEFGDANIGIWTYSSEKVTIQHSTSFRNKSTTSSDGGGFDIDGGTWDCVLQHNMSYENDGAGYLVYEYGDPLKMRNNEVRYNIAYNNGRKNTQYGGITLGGLAPQKDVKLLNNTIVQDKGKAITLLGYAIQGTLAIKNNILYSPESPYLAGDYANNVFRDILLTQTFMPEANSPVIDEALELAGLPVHDFYGKMIVSGKRDIGAVEH